MAKEDKFAGEVMSDEELDQVAGGTTGQTLEIINLIGRVVKDGNYDRNLGFWEVADYLRNNYKIEAQIFYDTDYLGTGLGNKANTYTHNGKTITHQQVINVIKAYNG